MSIPRVKESAYFLCKKRERTCDMAPEPRSFEAVAQYLWDAYLGACPFLPLSASH